MKVGKETLGGSASTTGALFCHPIPFIATPAKAGDQCTDNVQAMPAGFPAFAGMTSI